MLGSRQIHNRLTLHRRVGLTGFDCPVLDTLFLAAPIAFKGRLVQYAGRILQSYPGRATAEIHDYVDFNTRVLASALGKRAPGYTSLGFPTPAVDEEPTTLATPNLPIW